MRDRNSLFSFRPTESLLFGASGLFGMFVVLSNPVAVGLPIAGTLAATAMLWSIDTLQDRIATPVSIDSPGETDESEQTYSQESTLQSEEGSLCSDESNGPTPCSAD